MKDELRAYVDRASGIFTRAITPVIRKQAELGPVKLPATYRVWDSAHLSPVAHHYYQPIFNPNDIAEATWTTRQPLHGIDLNTDGQLSLLRAFSYGSELTSIPSEMGANDLEFYYNNGFFESGDAEILYSMVRHFKPSRVVEIGCGYSTRLIKRALDKNREEGASATQICIEPYEAPWLERLGVDSVIRSRVEDLDTELFDQLDENCLLFIDSSHVLRTGGDVYTEYLRILPRLHSGVVVHIHDIFLPHDYPRQWVVSYRRFWTEQYLLQAFLSFNDQFRIIAALHYLDTDFPDAFASACPVFAQQTARRRDPNAIVVSPSSFWMQRC